MSIIVFRRERNQSRLVSYNQGTAEPGQEGQLQKDAQELMLKWLYMSN